MRLITSNDEISLCQLLLKQKLKEGKFEEITLDRFVYPGGYEPNATLLWNSSMNIWYYYKKLFHPDYKYWNTFGIEKPFQGMSTTCEVNVPLYGERKTQGLFAAKGDKVFLLHRGKRMGGTGVNAEVIANHFAQYNHPTKELDGNKLLLVGELTSDNFLEQLHTFIKRQNEL
ncbi:hypothetical protein CIB95_11890 [Lottiidibacillus patelloidae]|uniref:Uncharacterized protein n=1 Tax=Lottiidibacillus patelloidae TaxID=2670334 RepID=A0A263BRX9_9BACI|nr:hypothetical protein [Lottiidibacillus patelloidae]OZM56470.1 hypothetical protein CIB95_11890 [Lottiidibacillus patelloidae]